MEVSSPKRPWGAARLRELRVGGALQQAASHGGGGRGATSIRSRAGSRMEGAEVSGAEMLLTLSLPLSPPGRGTPRSASDEAPAVLRGSGIRMSASEILSP